MHGERIFIAKRPSREIGRKMECDVCSHRATALKRARGYQDLSQGGFHGPFNSLQLT